MSNRDFHASWTGIHRATYVSTNIEKVETFLDGWKYYCAEQCHTLTGTGNELFEECEQLSDYTTDTTTKEKSWWGRCNFNRIPARSYALVPDKSRMVTFADDTVQERTYVYWRAGSHTILGEWHPMLAHGVAPDRLEGMVLTRSDNGVDGSMRIVNNTLRQTTYSPLTQMGDNRWHHYMVYTDTQDPNNNKLFMLG